MEILILIVAIALLLALLQIRDAQIVLAIILGCILIVFAPKVYASMREKMSRRN